MMKDIPKFNTMKDQQYFESYINIQSVPRSKHTSSPL